MRTLSRRRLLAAFGSAPLAVGLAGCSASGSSASVGMRAFAFQPRTLRVAPGTTVEWVNDSPVPHTVTARTDALPADASYFASGGFDTEAAARRDVPGGLLHPDDTFSHTFDRPGRYAYYCIPHESSGMTGTVVVD